MWFKKNNIKKTSSFIPNLIWITALCLIFLMWLVLIKNTPFFKFKVDTINSLNPNTKEKENESQILKEIDKKESKNDKINILVAWRWWWDHDAPNLTDTIILTSINTKSKLISMLSIPRDFYVEYPWDDNGGKINWLYAKYHYESSSQKNWMEILKKKVSEITWEDIDYFINIDFNWFKAIIDTIGWIEITVPANFVDEQYPDWNWGYKTLIFKKWTWIFDWENALKYSRSRHSTSDFDRSIRQQQIIWAIKDKLTWSYFLTSPWKIKELYEVFINHLYTDLTLSTIIKLAYYLNWSWDFKIITSNLNDSCFYWSNTCEKWWFLYTPSREFFWWMSVLLAEWTNSEKLNNYDELHNFTNIVFNNPELFNENYKINIFNSLKVNHLAWVLSNNIVKYWFNVPPVNSIWNTQDLYEKSIIYYNNIDENSTTLRALKSFFNWEFIKTNFPKYSKDNANIEIIIWEDYLWDKEIFKF
jgi:LCP family protein required for cell wall assembly